jgi:hypothetical protein
MGELHLQGEAPSVGASEVTEPSLTGAGRPSSSKLPKTRKFLRTGVADAGGVGTALSVYVGVEEQGNGIASRSPGSSIAKLLTANSVIKGTPSRGHRPSAMNAVPGSLGTQ